jgi:hypothetical protein
MTNSDYSNFAQLLASWLGLPLPILVTLAMAGIIGWVCWRTRSTHVLTLRLWKLVYGKAAMADRAIAELIENRERLIKFRFFTGLQVRTLPQAMRLTSWAKKNDVEMAEVKACGHHFDLETFRVRKRLPGDLELFGLALWAAACGVVLMAALAGSATDRAILKFNNSGTWFVLSTDAAVSWKGRTRITASDCHAQVGVGPLAPFTAEEKSSICEALTGPTNSTFIDHAVHEQRIAFGGVAPAFAFFSFVAWGAFRRGAFARALKERLDIQGSATDDSPKPT